MTALHELVAARLCHDLASPLSAIGNGTALLQAMPGDAEVSALVADTVATAQARLMLLRLAFGPAGPGDSVAGAEIAQALTRDPPAARLAVDWDATGPLPRPEARAALLALICAASACGAQGRIAVARDATGWTVAAEAPRPVALPAFWAIAEGAPPPADLAPRMVHFALLPLVLADLGRRLVHDGPPEAFRLRF